MYTRLKKVEKKNTISTYKEDTIYLQGMLSPLMSFPNAFWISKNFKGLTITSTSQCNMIYSLYN